MLGMVGITGILGCGALIAGLIISAVTIATTVITSEVSRQQQEEQQDEMLELQKEQEDKQLARLESQKEVNGRRLERTHIKNLMAMGTSIAFSECSAVRKKHELAKTYAEMGKKSKGNKKNYSYGKPAQPSSETGQSQSQPNA